MAKIDRWVSREGLMQVEAWAAACTDQELAERLGVSRSTLAQWKKTNSNISDAVTRGRADTHACAQVEQTLLQRALGYDAVVKKAVKIRNAAYENGKRVSEKEEVVLVEETQHVPGDVNAIKFFLTNRVPERWKSRIETEGDEASREVTVRFEGTEESEK